MAVADKTTFPSLLPSNSRVVMGLGFRVHCGILSRWAPHPVIVTIGNSTDSIGVRLYSYYLTIAGQGGLLR